MRKRNDDIDISGLFFIYYRRPENMISVDGATGERTEHRWTDTVLETFSPAQTGIGIALQAAIDDPNVHGVIAGRGEDYARLVWERFPSILIHDGAQVSPQLMRYSHQERAVFQAAYDAMLPECEAAPTPCTVPAQQAGYDAVELYQQMRGE